MSGAAKTIFIISDGTGETAATMIRAALVQYSDHETNLIRYKNIRSEMMLEPVVQEAFNQRAMIVYTIVASSLRKSLQNACSEKGLLSIDLLGPILQTLDQFFEIEGERTTQAGKLRVVNDQYFKRIEAIEYTVKHDDGKTMYALDKADIILVGISRTSKTPLSIFLSHKGYKVANVPLVLGTPLPKELFTIDQRKVVALIIEIDSLQKIRRNRLEKFGQDPGSEYASLQHISREIEYAHELYKQNRRWPVFDVTDRALEETATEIIKVVGSRLGWSDSDSI